MNGDYLDVLLGRAKGDIPTVEPRIQPFAPLFPGPDLPEEVTETETLVPGAADVPAQPVTPPRRESPSSVVQNSFRPRIVYETSEFAEVHTGRVVEHTISEIHEHRETKLTRTASTLANHPAEQSARPIAPSPAREVANEWRPAPSQPPSVVPATQTKTIQPVPSKPRLEQPDEDAAPAPVSIRIERIEVRTAPPAERRERVPQKPAPRPQMTLDEYLKRRNGGNW